MKRVISCVCGKVVLTQHNDKVNVSLIHLYGTDDYGDYSTEDVNLTENEICNAICNRFELETWPDEMYYDEEYEIED